MFARLNLRRCSVFLGLGLTLACDPTTEGFADDTYRAKPTLDCGDLATFTVSGSSYAYGEAYDYLDALESQARGAVVNLAYAQFDCDECQAPKKGCDKTHDWSHPQSTVGMYSQGDDLECVQEPNVGNPPTLSWLCRGTVTVTDAVLRAGCTGCK